MEPGPRSIALPGAARSAVLVLVLAAALAGCGTSTPPSASPAMATSSGTPSAGASGAAGPEASGARWPGGTVLAVIALGSADGELQKAGADLQSAVDKQDLGAMRGAADGLAKLIDQLTPEIARLETYPLTQPAGALYRTAFPELGAGAAKLRDAITAGDAAGILAGSQEIAHGLADYAPARRALSPLVEQAILQQRLLVK
jgi:hypothetical protein